MDLNSIQESRQVAEWRATIEELGGIWIGVQAPLAFSDEYRHMVVFVPPNAKTSVRLSVSEMTRSNILKAMGITEQVKRDTVGHLEHAARRLRSFAKRIILTAEEIEEEIECLKNRT